MLHYSCDICKRPIDTHADVHHVVKIEVFPAVDDVADHGCCEGNGQHVASQEAVSYTHLTLPTILRV